MHFGVVEQNTGPWQYRCASHRNTTAKFYPDSIDETISPVYYSPIQPKTDLTVIDTTTPSCSSFNRHKRIATGSLLVKAMAGFEEGSRALFANDAAQCRLQTEAWPADVRDYIWCLDYPLPLAEVPSPTP